MTTPTRYFQERSYTMPRSQWAMETGLSESTPDNDLALAYVAVVRKQLRKKRDPLDFGPWFAEAGAEVTQVVLPEEVFMLDSVAGSGNAEVLLESISPLTENPNDITATYQVEIIPTVENIATPPAVPEVKASQTPWLFAGLATAVLGVWFLLRRK